MDSPDFPIPTPAQVERWKEAKRLAMLKPNPYGEACRKAKEEGRLPEFLGLVARQFSEGFEDEDPPF